MNRIIKSCVSGAIVLGLVGCSNVSNQDVGTVGGAVVGGLIGSQFGGGLGQAAAIGAGMVVGGMIGGKIGQSMDEVDRMKINQALERNQSEQSTHWVNPDNGNQYTVTPRRPYNRSGRVCRRYVVDGIINGKHEKIYGTACRMSNGKWRAVNLP